jgi:hypothetical protein
MPVAEWSGSRSSRAIPPYKRAALLWRAFAASVVVCLSNNASDPAHEQERSSAVVTDLGIYETRI